MLHSAGTRLLCRPHLSDHAPKDVIHAEQAKAGSCTGCRTREKEDENAPLANSEDAEARHTASTQSQRSTKSCARYWIIDRDRSDRCSLHHGGSCNRFAGVAHHILRGFAYYCMMKCSAGGRLCVIPKGVLRFVVF